MIIGISGPIKSGKDLVGDIISERFGGNIERKSFGNKLKEIVAIMIGCTREDLDSQEFKATPIGEEWVNFKIGRLNFLTYEEAKKAAYEFDVAEDKIKKYYLTPRDLLQRVGTEGARRVVHPNVWCLALFRDYDASKKQDWLITDVRFNNEKDIVEQNGGLNIRIKRKFANRFPEYAHLAKPESPYDIPSELAKEDSELYEKLTHDSETMLDKAHFDYVIYNDGTISNLKDEINNILTMEIA